jgi:hypothetical protein
MRYFMESLLAGLGHGVDAHPIVLNGDQCRRRREVAVPDIVVDTLRVPDSLTGICIDGDQCVGEKVDADPVSAIKSRRLVSW